MGAGSSTAADTAPGLAVELRMTADVSVEGVVAIAESAGAAIMRVFDQEADSWGMGLKDSACPLNKAYKAASAIITHELRSVSPHIPIISQDTRGEAWDVRQKYEYAWVVDALDGTCAFEQRSPDFSVNIALLFKGSPLLGVVHVPYAAATYWAVKEKGAWVKTGAEAGRGGDSHRSSSQRRLTAAQFGFGDRGLVIALARGQTPMLHPEADDVHTAPTTAAQDSSSSSSSSTQGSVRPHVTKAAQAGVGGQVQGCQAQGGQVQGVNPAPGPGPASASAVAYEAGPLGPSLSSPLPSAANGHSLMSGGGSFRDQGTPAKPPQSAGAAGAEAGAGGMATAVLPSFKGSGQLQGSFQAAPGGSQTPTRAGSAPVPDAPAAHLPSALSTPANGVLGGRGGASTPAVSATGASTAAATTANTPLVGDAVNGAGAGAVPGGPGSNRQVPGSSAAGGPVQVMTGGLPGIGFGRSVARQPSAGVRETGELLQVLNAPQALEVSSTCLRLVAVAGGAAHLCPCMGSVYEWDVAAADIIVREAGGVVLNAGTSAEAEDWQAALLLGQPVLYNSRQLLAPPLVAFGHSRPEQAAPDALAKGSFSWLGRE